MPMPPLVPGQPRYMHPEEIFEPKWGVGDGPDMPQDPSRVRFDPDYPEFKEYESVESGWVDKKDPGADADFRGNDLDTAELDGDRKITEKHGPRKDPRWHALWILLTAQGIHVSSTATTGVPLPPDTGEGLAAGVGAFRGASEILGSAGSDPGWQGAAAQAYDDRNTEQQARTEKMANLDAQFADLLKTQATQVRHLRYEMAGIAAFLTVAMRSAWKIYQNPPPYGPAVSFQFQTAVASMCLAADVALLGHQGYRSEGTGAALKLVADGYAQIASAARASMPLK